MNFWRLVLLVSYLLANVASGWAGTVVRFHTSLGDMDVELFDADKPATVQNFLAYMQGGLYTNTIMHRVETNFVIQGGGIFVSNRGKANPSLEYIPTFAPITNEFLVGTFFSNVYGTIAMAKTSDPDSATSQFFFNLADNSASLDDTNNSGGFTVFGHVLSGTNILNLFEIGPTNRVVKQVNLGDVLSELPVLYSANPAKVQYDDLIYVNIGILPAIQAQPQSQLVLVGQNAAFTVAATGTAPLRYQWKFNGTAISGATASRYTRTTAQLTHAGIYTVGVSNAVGGVISANAVLTVVVPVAISVQPKGKTVPLGGTLKLSVTATGSAPLHYQWSRNGVALTNDARVSGATGPALAIVNVAAGDSGSYQVAVNNAGTTTNSASASVIVASEATRPTISISSPVAGQRWSNVVFTAKGKASDNVRLAEVRYRLNDGDWGPALTSNGWTNWTASLTLVPGTNILMAYSTDMSGNRSLTNTVKFSYVVTDRLNLQVIGRGKFSPNYSNAVLEIGRAYTMTATPAAGFVFSNWTGAVFTNIPKVRFVMQSNLVLQASFVPNPFLAVQGNYSGLFSDTNRAHESSGFLSLAVADHGAYTCKILIANTNYSFTDQFDVAGFASKSISRPRTNALVLSMTLGFAPDSPLLLGTLDEGHWEAQVAANRSGFDGVKKRATQYAGKYTLIIPGGGDDDTVPQGHGYGTVVVDSAGKVNLSGLLADGTALTKTAYLSADGQWPLYAQLYSGRGSMWSWLQFDTNTAPVTVQGNLSWIKTARPADKYYREGFTNSVLAHGSFYLRPAGTTNRVINLTDGAVSFEGGNLVAPFTNLVTLVIPNNKVVNDSSNQLSLTLRACLKIHDRWSVSEPPAQNIFATT